MWRLIRKDLIRRWRSPLATLVMIAFPLFMSAAIGSISGGGGGDGDEFPRIKILIENRDRGGFLSDTIVGMLAGEQGQEYMDVIAVGPEGQAMIEDGQASALVILPGNFTDDVLSGRPASILVLRNPAEGIKPEIVVQGAQVLSTYLDQGARLLGPELGVLNTLLKADEVPAAAKVGLLAAQITERITAVQRYLFPPLMKVGSVKEVEEEDAGGGSVYGYILIMTTVMALMFVSSRTMSDLYEEQNNGMLRRTLSTPLGIGRIVTAKMVFGVVFGVIVMCILGAIGLLMKWIELPLDPAGFLLLGVTMNLAVCGLLALMMGLVKNEKQAGIFSWLVIMGMSALGGSMVPIEQMPAPMQAVAPFTVTYWAIGGFTDLVFDAARVTDILRHVGVLLAIGLGANVVAHFLLVRRFREVTP